MERAQGPELRRRGHRPGHPDAATEGASRQAAFIEALTALALEHEARPNLIKDSSLDAESARRGIADFEAAANGCAASIRGALQRSELTRRLGL